MNSQGMNTPATKRTNNRSGYPTTADQTEKLIENGETTTTHSA